jgi:hypothetical protein
MPPPLERRFSWRGVLLIAFSFALIGLAVLFRKHDAPPGTTRWLPTQGELKLLSAVVVTGVPAVVAAFLGSWCGYLRLAFRFRKLAKTDDHYRSQVKELTR